MLMGAGTSLDTLNSRKATVKEGMENSRGMIDAAGEKVSRLQKASSSLETSIQSFKNIKGKIDEFEVTKSKWEGDEQSNFQGKYNSYAIFVDSYESDISKAKEQIDEDLEAARAEKASAEIGLENLESTLDRIESDIKTAKED